MNTTLNIGFLLFPRVTQLDLTGPAQILGRLPGARTHLVWKSLAPVPTDVGFTINPTTTFDDCPQLDVLCVPGGFGILPLLEDGDTLDFLRRQADAARYVTSVCNGSLVLGAAGLLQGYRAACHWQWRHYLPRFGAIPVAERVVRDRNRVSGGGVTAGIDFGLTLAAELAGEDVAKGVAACFRVRSAAAIRLRRARAGGTGAGGAHRCRAGRAACPDGSEIIQFVSGCSSCKRM